MPSIFLCGITFKVGSLPDILTEASANRLSSRRQSCRSRTSAIPPGLLTYPVIAACTLAAALVTCCAFASTSVQKFPSSACTTKVNAFTGPLLPLLQHHLRRVFHLGHDQKPLRRLRRSARRS